MTINENKWNWGKGKAAGSKLRTWLKIATGCCSGKFNGNNAAYE